MKKNKGLKKMNLAKETVANLDPANLMIVGGAVICQESNRICSIQHTCVSCVYTQDTCA
ncbi:MAG: class I lanthipeptide [Thermoanaerobaculia bacterium]